MTAIRYLSRFFRIVAVTVLSLSPATRGLYSQSQAIDGVIQGTVRGDNGLALAGVDVGFRNQDNGAVRRVRTDTAGRYRAPLLPIGNYEIAAEREGFIGTRQAGVVLELGQTLTVNFSLMRALSSSQTVTIITRAPLVEGDRKQPSTTINRKFVEDLPVYGRKFMDLGVMVPGATEFGDRDTSATADFVGVNHFYSNAIVDGTDAYQAWSGLPNGKKQQNAAQQGHQRYDAGGGETGLQVGHPAGWKPDRFIRLVIMRSNHAFSIDDTVNGD